jgi:hypothetical protein
MLKSDGQVVFTKTEFSLDEFCQVVVVVGVTLDQVRKEGTFRWFNQRRREEVAAAGIVLQQSAGAGAIDAVLAKVRGPGVRDATFAARAKSSASHTRQLPRNTLRIETDECCVDLGLSGTPLANIRPGDRLRIGVCIRGGGEKSR